MPRTADIWIKAAVIGSLWGATEIVLGSFLHNLRMPFSGNILTAIGIILMVSGHRLWPHRGMLIRAGLICAALKTLSPSPVILGPMLSIFMQAALMESVLFFTRRNNLGYILGGGLAVSWNLFYRILSTIVLYGSSLIALYQNIIDYFISQTSWTMESYWGPILILWAIFFAWGAAAGLLGILVSRSAINNKNIWNIRESDKMHGGLYETRRGKTENVPVSLLFLRLGGIIAILASGLYSINMLPVHQNALILIIFLLVLWFYDRNILLRFARKRGFWLALAIMISLSGFLMGDSPGFSSEGLLVGMHMGMRAIYVIGGFSLVSAELQRPEMAVLYSGPRMAPFLTAVRVAFQTTPLIMDSIPGKHAWKRPGRVLTQMVGNMDNALEYMRGKFDRSPLVVVVTGQKGAGKTTLVSRVVESLKSQGIQVKGILAPAFFDNGKRAGYHVRDIKTGEKTTLCKRDESITGNVPGKYRFFDEGLLFGEKALWIENLQDTDLVVVDEAGPFELRGQGWDGALQDIVTHHKGPLLLVIRESLINEIAEKYGLAISATFEAESTSPDQLVSKILSLR